MRGRVIVLIAFLALSQVAASQHEHVMVEDSIQWDTAKCETSNGKDGTKSRQRMHYICSFRNISGCQKTSDGAWSSWSGCKEK